MGSCLETQANAISPRLPLRTEADHRRGVVEEGSTPMTSQRIWSCFAAGPTVRISRARMTGAVTVTLMLCPAEAPLNRQP